MQLSYFTKEVRRKFQKRIRVQGQNECWPFLKLSGVPYKPSHYGKFGVYNPELERNQTLGSHVIAWIIHNQKVPKRRKFVLHKCDTPHCCNPQHLFLGDHQDNMRDMVEKNRNNPGRPGLCKWSRKPPKGIPKILQSLMGIKYTKVNNFIIAISQYPVGEKWEVWMWSTPITQLDNGTFKIGKPYWKKCSRLGLGYTLYNNAYRAIFKHCENAAK